MKVFGLLLLALIPALLTFRLSEEVRMKEKRRQGFLALLIHMHFQIENFLADQKEIFQDFSHPILTKSDFYKTLSEEVDRSPCGAFARAWETHRDDFSFPGNANDLLEHLAEHFGFLEKNSQLAELSRAIAILEDIGEKSKTESENKIKILRVSGLTAGLGILILLI